MGNAILKGRKNAHIPPLLEETQIFALWSITDVRELYKRFQNQVYGFALVEAQFESIIAFKPEVAQHVPLELLFDILDNDNDGRVDGLELLGGLTLCCHATFEEKARFCFELFDFNLNSIMSKNELVMMMMSSICGMNLLTGGGEELEPELEVFEALAADALARADLNSDGQIDYQEFLYWARSNRDLMTGLEALNRIAMEAIADIDPEDSAPETDDGDLSDTDPNNKVKSILQGEGVVQKSQKQIGSEISAMFNAPSAGDQGAADASNITPWKTQVFEPTNFKKKRDTNEGPATNLELSWAFGYKALNCRNNVRYVGSPDGEQHIVYFTAALGILYNPRTRTQSFYMGHTDAITCLSLHPNNQIVATADVKAHIHIWNVETPSAGSVAITALSVIKGFVKEGLLHVLFSPGGDRIVTVGRDNDHTICIHDVNSGQIISSAKGLVNPNFVFDIAFNAAGTELAVVGKQEIRFYTGVHTKKRAIDSYSGKIGKNGKRQTFFSVVYIREDAIVGCASGELYRFHEKHCVEIVQAHGLREPVLCLFYNSNDGTLFSGGKDCIIKMWDSSLRSVGEQIDLSEDVDGDGKADSGSLDSALISIQNYENVMLVGTRGSDIFQVTLPKRPGTPHAMERIAWGHATGDVWGLAVHPIREEFATCGDDKTLRIWSIRTHEQVNLRQMPEVSRSLAYSPNGEILCLGMADGSMALMEVNSPILRVYATWKHSEIIITDIKFSPNGNFIAAGSGDSNIYVYASDDKVEFRRHAVCRGHSASITHLDFSANSAHIQSNGADNALLFWNLQGNQVKNSSSLRDTAWATYTCTFGWPMQGIWPPDCEYEDINACQALPDIGDIVTGDDFHKVNLFKYPALKSGALHKTYVGHSSHVTCVRFSASKRYVVSVGGNDRTILLWKHSIELDESDIDDADDADGSSGNSSDSSGAASSSSGEGAGLPTAHGIYIANEIADVGPRSIEQEAVNIGWSVQDLQEYVQQHKSMVFANKSKAGTNASGAAAEPVAQWKSAIVEPSRWKREDGSTDVDLTLKWVHGFRAHDCRNSVLYSAAGDIVYNAAALAVVYNKGAGKQQYLMAAHVDEVIGLCRHPAGQIFASGEAGSQPSIVIWNSKDMQVQSKISKVHQRGVPLLAFNSKGNVLASIGLDADNTLCLHEWMKAVEILRTPTEKSRILALCFLANDSTSAQSDYEGTMTTTAFTGNAGERPGTDIVVTAGVKHLKFWWAQGRNVQSQRALWGSSRVCRKEKEGTVMCVASTNKHICVTGSDTGSLIVWKNFKLVCHVPSIFGAAAQHPDSIDLNPSALNHPDNDHDLKQFDVEYPHRGPILCMHAVPGVIERKMDLSSCAAGYAEASRYITGDKNGVIAVWRLVETNNENLRLVLMKSFHIMQLKPSPLRYEVRSICERDETYLIGLKSNEIFEINDSTIPLISTCRMDQSSGLPTLQTEGALSPVRGLPPRVVSSTEFSGGAGAIIDSRRLSPLRAQRIDIGHSTGEVWGLAVHPYLPVFLTAGDDCTVKCWHLETNRLISYFLVPDKCRSVDICGCTSRFPVADGQGAAQGDAEGINFAIALNNCEIWVLKMGLVLNPESKPRYQNHVDPQLDGKDVTPKLNMEAVLSRIMEESESAAAATATATAGADAPPAAAAAAAAVDAAAVTAIRSEYEPFFAQEGPTQWVQVLKYSFDGSILAAGSHDKKIYVYNTDSYSLRCVLEGHVAYVTHLDFGIMLRSNEQLPPVMKKELIGGREEVVMEATTISEALDKESGQIDVVKVIRTSLQGKPLSKRVVEETRAVKREEIYIQSTSGMKELLFWQDGKRVISASAVKDVYWATFTCPFGWPVQGIWPATYDGTDVNAVARSNSWEKVPVLSTVDNFGRVRLYNYPCVNPGAPDKCYKGHASNVTNVVFSADDNYCISIGGSDKCVFVWETDIQDEIRERAAYLSIGGAGGGASGGSSSSSALDTILEDDANEALAADVGNDAADEGGEDLDAAAAAEESFSVLKAAPTMGDQFGAVKPWKGAVREPSNWKEPPGAGEAPEANLEMKFVYGYRGWDARNNVNFADSRFEVVYHVGATGIVFDTQQNKQLHNTEHSDDILCLAVHPLGHTVATGEIGKFPKIAIWDANTGVTVQVIQYHKRGVSNIAFSQCGQLIVSTGMDDDRSVVVHNVSNGAMLGKGKAGRGVEIYTLNVGGSGTFVTGGKNHIKFWEMPGADSPGGELSSKTGIYSMKMVKARTVVSSAYLGNDPVSGMNDGTLVMWKDRTSNKYVKAHQGPVTAMFAITNTTPGIDSKEHGPRIISGGKDGFVHVWDLQIKKIWSLDMNLTTPKSINPQVQAVAAKENRLLVGTKASEIYEISMLSSNEVHRLVQGHYDTRAELWGLDTHPCMSRFVTCGDDMTVRLWDAKNMQQIAITDLGSKLRAVCFYPDGSLIAVATYDGKVQVITSDLQTVQAEITLTTKWIQVLRYSPAGDLLAVGAHDGIIYMLDTKSYSVRYRMRGHHSYITGLDFSTNGVLQSTSGDYELLFWNVNTGKQILSPTDVRDAVWSTFTCTLGWPVQGIWPPCADGTDINTVDASPDRQFLVTGDDDCSVKLFKYPCVKPNSKCKAYKGHAEHVVRAKFSHDGKHVFTIGGLDKTIIQFEIKFEKGVKSKITKA